MATTGTVRTRFFVISDTHGRADSLPHSTPDNIDVVIHCGDLTDGSKVQEYKDTIQLLQEIKAPLKLVIAGNHDFTLDIPMFKKKIAEVKPTLDPALVEREYGYYGQARALFDEVKDDGITFLDEGTHHFTLSNGAALKVYASPFTPSASDWAFEYSPDEDHDWSIEKDTDIVITHGPPRGIFDMSNAQRLGSPSLFTAVATTRPRMHCFGHVHSGWGAKLAAWRPRETISGPPTHFNAFDHQKSVTIKTLSSLTRGKYDVADIATAKADMLRTYLDRGFVCASDGASRCGMEEYTLFVNAAVQGVSDKLPVQLPWLVEVDLPLAPRATKQPDQCSRTHDGHKSGDDGLGGYRGDKHGGDTEEGDGRNDGVSRKRLKT
ncbi:hypothetical protein ANO11243_080210 [Dothideomycetidae sp. 11243]|nr:hypothetical protein ANO11243_080210 [fungal sp. No.11243]